MTARGSRFESSAPWGRGRAVVGNAIYHSVGDIENAVKQLALGYDQAYADIATQVGVIPYEGSGERVKRHPDWYAWWKSVAEPAFNAFIEFRREMLGGVRSFADAYIAYGNRFAVTDWDGEIGKWQRTLITLRELAARVGMKLDSPHPAPLPTTLPEDAAALARRLKDKAGDAAHDVWSLAKVAIYGGLGLVGVVAVSSLVSNLKTGKDPAENYMRLARR